jgi:hypothetical protein
MRLIFAASGALTRDPMVAMSNFLKDLVLSSGRVVFSFWVVGLCLYGSWRMPQNFLSELI